MKRIPLSQGYYAIVDDEDFDRVSQFKWSVHVPKGKGPRSAMRSLKRKNGRRKSITMHRFILNAKPGQMIDHANRNPLDNRRCNLRFCNDTQNTVNKQKYM